MRSSPHLYQISSASVGFIYIYPAEAKEGFSCFNQQINLHLQYHISRRTVQGTGSYFPRYPFRLCSSGTFRKSERKDQSLMDSSDPGSWQPCRLQCLLLHLQRFRFTAPRLLQRRKQTDLQYTFLHFPVPA